MGAALCVPQAPYAGDPSSLSPVALSSVPAGASAAPLPTLIGRLSRPASNWDEWSIRDLERWCRESIRARPHQSSIALLVCSTERGALLDLVCESYDGETRQTDAALRLKKGRVDVEGAFALLTPSFPPFHRGARTRRNAAPPHPPPPPHPHTHPPMLAAALANAAARGAAASVLDGDDDDHAPAGSGRRASSGVGAGRRASASGARRGGARGGGEDDEDDDDDGGGGGGGWGGGGGGGGSWRGGGGGRAAGGGGLAAAAGVSPALRSGGGGSRGGSPSLDGTIAALQAAMSDAARAHADAESARERDAAAWAEEKRSLCAAWAEEKRVLGARVGAAEAAAAAAGGALAEERAARTSAASDSAATLGACAAEAEAARSAAEEALAAREREWGARLAAVKAAAAAEVRDAHAALQEHMNDAAHDLSAAEEAAARAVAAARGDGALAAARAAHAAEVAALQARCEKMDGEFRALMAEFDTLQEEEKGWTAALREKDEEITKLRGNLAAVSDVLQSNIEKVVELERELQGRRADARSPAVEHRQTTRLGVGSWLTGSPAGGKK
jgi:hypothetical protein